MENWDTLAGLLTLLIAALVLGTLAEQFRQSAIVGYLLAGTLVGPHGPTWLRLVDQQDVAIIAELGIALLLFTIGLEFSFRRLRSLGTTVLLAAVLQIVGTWAVVGAVAWFMGVSGGGAVAIGAMIALSSTAAVLRLLTDRAELETPSGRNAMGVLLLQDVAVLPMTLAVSALATGGGVGAIALKLGKTVVFGAVLVASFLVLFNVVVPRLLNIRRWASNREFPILLAIVLALGSAAAAHAIEVSPAIGAFLAGVLLAESPFATQIRADVVSLRTLMLTVFFASIGMMSDPAWAVANWYLVLGVAAAVIVGKVAVVFGVFRALASPPGIALATGLALAQVGEFSFVLAQMARDAKPQPMITPEIFNLLVAVTVIALFLTPYLIQAAPRIADRVEERRVRQQRAKAGAAAAAATDAGGGVTDPAAATDATASDATAASPPVVAERKPIVIIGFGPAGQRVAESLIANYLTEIKVVDLNPRAAAIAQRYGLAMHVGNAAQSEVLEHAGVRHAEVVVITTPDPQASSQVIHLCRHLNPNARLIVRARYHAFRWELQFAGAEIVVDEEEHVGLKLASEARRMLRARDQDDDDEA